MGFWYPLFHTQCTTKHLSSIPSHENGPSHRTPLWNPFCIIQCSVLNHHWHMDPMLWTLHATISRKNHQKEEGLTSLQKIIIGNIFSVLTMLSAGFVEGRRRGAPIRVTRVLWSVHHCWTHWVLQQRIAREDEKCR